MLAFLAINTTYRGPEVPGTAAALAYGLAVPDENATLMKKLKGGNLQKMMRGMKGMMPGMR